MWNIVITRLNVILNNASSSLRMPSHPQSIVVVTQKPSGYHKRNVKDETRYPLPPPVNAHAVIC